MKNTITALRQILETSGHVPGAFRINELSVDHYELQFTFGTIGIQPWKSITLRNGKAKIYKSLNAVFSDIRKLSHDHDETLIAYTQPPF